MRRMRSSDRSGRRPAEKGKIVGVDAVVPASRSQAGGDILELLRESEGYRPVEDTAVKEEERRMPGIFCRLCGHRVTSDDQRISVNGSHTHTFFNPAGILFEVGCFRLAPGCLVPWRGQRSVHLVCRLSVAAGPLQPMRQPSRLAFRKAWIRYSSASSCPN